jgi:hypothetical protein
MSQVVGSTPNIAEKPFARLVIANPDSSAQKNNIALAQLMIRCFLMGRKRIVELFNGDSFFNYSGEDKIVFT